MLLKPIKRDGRIVIIDWRRPGSPDSKFIEEILKLWQETYWKQAFEKIKIIIELNKRKKIFGGETVPGPLARVDENYVAKTGNQEIHISPVSKEDLLSNTYRQIVSHEQTHLLHLIQSKYLKVYVLEWKSVKEILRKIKILFTQEGMKSKGQALVNFKKALFFLGHLLLVEGLATYVENEMKEFHKQEDREELLNWYIEECGKFRAECINRDLKSGLNYSVDITKLNCNTYNLGAAMIYTMMYLKPELKIDDFLRMGPIEFIKLYEAIWSKNRNDQPFVSYSSGRGIFDFKRELLRVEKELRHYSKENIITDFRNVYAKLK